jgi:beta-lactamase class A
MGMAAVFVLLQGAALPAGPPPTSKLAGKTVLALPAAPLSLTYPMDELKERLQEATNIPKLRTGIFVYDPKNGRYLDLNGYQEFAAASMIKLPILVSLLAAIDRGEVKFDQPMVIRQDLITGGSGWLQWRAPGTKISLKETAELMMVISDNTATNMIIDLLGGKEKLSDEFAAWGLKQTRINNMLGDFTGTNKTSPFDLVYLMARIDRGEVLQSESKNVMLDIMKRTRIRTLLNQGMAPGATIAHKTGDIGMMVGDAGIITAPSGARYIVSVQVERPFNDRRANALIRLVSKGIYRCFSEDGTVCHQTEVGALNDELPKAAPAAVHHGRRRHSRHKH